MRTEEWFYKNTHPILLWFWGCMPCCRLACNTVLFHCLFSSFCFLFSPSFMLLIIPCSPLLPLHLEIYLSSSKWYASSWAGSALDFSMKCSVTGQISFYAKQLQIEVHQPGEEWRCGAIKIRKSGKMKSCIFHALLLFVSHVSLTVTFWSKIC